MTIVCFKGGILAADKQSTFAGLGWRTTKIRRMPDGSIAGAAGDTGVCRALMNWYESGADLESYPDKKNKCSLLVVGVDGKVWLYDGTPHPIEIEDKVYAMGSGRDYAVAAMHLGCSAKEAAEVACLFDTSCGRGIDVLRLEDLDAAA